MRESRYRLRPAALVGLVAVLLFQACDRGPVVDPPVDAPLVAAVEDVYTVGARTGEDWERFGRIGAVAFNAAGELSILDIQGHRVVVVGSDGSHVRTFGRRGDAPGELRRPFAFNVLADGRAVIFDYGWPAGFEVYGPDGAFARSARVDVRQGAPGAMLLPLPDGRLVSAGAPRFSLANSDDDESSAEESSAEEDHRREIHAFSLDGSDAEILYRAWGLPRAEALNRARAFEPGLHLAVLADGRLAVADSTTYTVKLVDADGQVTGTFGRAFAPVEVTDAIKEAVRAQRMASPGASPTSGPDSARLRETLMQHVETMAFADEIPVIADMAVDWDGRIWIARSPAEVGGNPIVDVLTPQGRYAGTLSAGGPAIPDAFGPDGLMAYVEAGALGVQRVRVTRLVGLGGH